MERQSLGANKVSIPPPPPGFTLDGQGSIPPPPEGFLLDAPANTAPKSRFGIKTALDILNPSAIPVDVANYAAKAGGAIGKSFGAGLKYLGVPELAVDLTVPQSEFDVKASLLAPQAIRGLGTVAGKAFAPMAGKMTQAAKSLAQIAKEKGIPLTSADITNSQILAGFESFLEKTPLGSPIIKEFRDKQIASFTKARDSLLAKFGPSMETFTGGTKLAELVKEGSQVAKIKADELYGKLRELVPPGAAVEFKNLQDTARRLIGNEESLPEAFRKSGAFTKLKSIVNFRGKQVREGIPDPLAGSGAPPPIPKNEIPLESLLELRSTLSQDIVDTDAAIKAGMAGMKGLSSKESGIYKQLYGALEKDLEGYSKSQNPAFKDAFDLARGSYREFKEAFDNKTIRRLINTNPERIVDGLIRPGNVTEINVLRTAAGPEGMTILKQKLAEKILGEAGGDLSPTALNRGLAKYGKETLQAVFNPQELKELAELGKVGSALKTAEKLAGNPSGTGRTVIYASNMGLAMASPVAGAGMFLGPLPAAKLYMSDAGRKLLTDGFNVVANTPEGVKLAGKIAAYLGAKSANDQSFYSQ